jgi:hypothetical protein
MKDFTIAIYCFLDDFLLEIDTKELDKRRKLTNSQVITTVILSAKYFYGTNHRLVHIWKSIMALKCLIKVILIEFYIV